MNQENFINLAKQKHGEQYNYSKTEYSKMRTLVTIICKTHGEFLQKPGKHLIGQGCPQCAHNRKLTPAEFFHRAREMHSGRYTYPDEFYTSMRGKILAICGIHGNFQIRAKNHLLQKQGCPVCGKKNRGRKKK